MIFIALYLIYSLVLLTGLGLLAGRALSYFFPSTFVIEDVGFVKTLLLGIIVLTAVLSYISLIYPINLVVHLLVTLGLVIWMIFDRTYLLTVVQKVYAQLRQNNYLLLIGAFCIVAGIVFASGPVKGYDTGLYHAQAVRWINEYGVVPGLGNLHFRLAFNSAWLVFSSFFDLLAFDGKAYHLVNLIIFTIGVMTCLKGLADLKQGRVKISSVVRSLLMLYLIARYKELASLSTDFPATAFLFFTLILVVESVEANIEQQNSRISFAASSPQNFYLGVLFTAFAVTVKLSVVPLGLFPLLLWGLLKGKRLRILIPGLVLGVIVFLPFLLRNLVLSGYLIFPLSNIDLFNFDWKVPYQNTLSIQEQTRYLVNTAEFNGQITLHVSLMEWLRNWYEIHIKGNLELTFYLLISPLFIAPFLYVCLGGDRFRRNVYLLLIECLLGIGVIFWLLSGPEPRLGAGWILSVAIFPLAVLIHYGVQTAGENGRKLPTYFANGLLLIFCLWLVQASGFRARLIGEDAYLIWTIEPLPEPKLRIVETAAGLGVFVPAQGNQTWDAVLPNSPYVNDNLELRGNSMVDGFRIGHR